ncbi:hypothetical protein PVAR5_9037 [Paecilomyces variotii No. 5]|uniref:Uncharacterized protein n=1 Tax=Byssochlamys spectabilis (strain No. 5 / NBRC 109023) TaxID=1356009 RepID=V5FQD0_BYSSN|nr:hypothetical protein PVAR5_9037 [Paecilomyces variotii No. 5]
MDNLQEILYWLPSQCTTTSAQTQTSTDSSSSQSTGSPLPTPTIRPVASGTRSHNVVVNRQPFQDITNLAVSKTAPLSPRPADGGTPVPVPVPKQITYTTPAAPREIFSSYGSNPSTQSRKRGRPKGSKNQPKRQKTSDAPNPDDEAKKRWAFLDEGHQPLVKPQVYAADNDDYSPPNLKPKKFYKEGARFLTKSRNTLTPKGFEVTKPRRTYPRRVKADTYNHVQEDSYNREYEPNSNNYDTAPSNSNKTTWPQAC